MAFALQVLSLTFPSPGNNPLVARGARLADAIFASGDAPGCARCAQDCAQDLRTNEHRSALGCTFASIKIASAVSLSFL